MMAAVRSDDKKTFDGASDLRAHYGGIRARLNPAPSRVPPPGTATAPAVGTPRAAPSAPLAVERGAASPEALRTIPLEIRDVVCSVAVTLGLAPLDILSDLGTSASLGRRVASALVVRRSLIAAPATAGLFGVAEPVVTGALATLDAVLAFTQASATHAPLDPLVRQVVAEWGRFEEHARVRIPVGEVQEIVARIFGVSVTDMKSARRTDDIVRPRHIAMYLAKRFTLRSLPEIAHAFGGRDHTTAVYAVKKVAAYANAVAPKIGGAATIEDWARALRDEMD